MSARSDAMLPVYLGTYRRPGHYVWTSDGRKGHSHDDQKPFLTLDDGKWCGGRTEGAARVTHLADAFTVLGFANRTDDKRGGSHAVFCLRGRLDYAEAVEAARAAFPWVWEHFAFEVFHVDTVEPPAPAPVSSNPASEEGR